MWLWIRERIWRLFSRAPLPLPAIEVPALPAPEPTLPEPTRARRTAPEIDPTAPEFYFKRAILDKLDDYFEILGRMRKSDRDNYDLFAKIGMTLSASTMMYVHKELPLWFRQTLPAFGAVAWGIDEAIYKNEHETETINPRLLYFRKYRAGYSPPEIQPVGTGHVYVMSLYYDDHKSKDGPKNRISLAFEIPVVVLPTGKVVALKTHITERKQIRGKYGQWRGRKFSLTQSRWGISKYYEEWADEKRGKHGWPTDLTAQQLIEHTFIFAANRIEEAQHSSVRVAVSKNGLTGTFGIPVTRSAYFFKDRERAPGSRSRIFHVVRAHERIIRNGKVTVRLHYRGLRQFTWNGYDVTVFVPGRHGLDLATFDVGAMDEAFFNEEVKTIGTGKLGKYLRATMLGERLNGNDGRPLP